MLLLYEVQGVKQAFLNDRFRHPLDAIRTHLALETKRSHRVYYGGDSFTLNR
jgi:hypothetical protein